MAHKEQQDFFKAVKIIKPEFFSKVNVLDCGSQDINGNNRYLFEESNYFGIDICRGNNVDMAIPVSLFYQTLFNDPYDVVISSEMLEHDRTWSLSLYCMYKMLKSGGLMLFTCATTGRTRHGVFDNRPSDSPATNDYYRNLSERDIRDCLNVDVLFSDYYFEVNNKTFDLYFWGIKK